MTASLLERPVVAARTAPPARLLPDGWPLYVLLWGYPLWWFLGLQAFVWPIVAVPMALALMRQKSVRIPKGFGIYLVFVLWMFGSALQLSGGSRVLAYLYRGSLYVSAAILLLYLLNRPKDKLNTRVLVNGLASLWGVTVLGGFAGILFPRVQFASLTEKLLPGSLAHNSFVYSMVHPGFADTTTLLGFALARPKAPFNYTNEWGSNLAILTPIAVYALLLARRRLWRWAIAIGLVASVVPIVLSINRGLWISLGVGVLYVAVRVGLRGNLRVLLGTFGTLAVAGAVVVATPLGNVVIQRIAHPNTQGRAYLYQQATDSAMESPLLGHGAPVSSGTNVAAGASVGTHGQLWTLLVSQGFPGLILFVGFFVALFLLTWRVGNRALWAHAAIVIALVQLPVYNWLPVQINLVMLAAVICWREVTAHAPPVPSSPGPVMWPLPVRARRRLFPGPSAHAPAARDRAGSPGAPAEDGADAELRRMARGGTFNLVAVGWMGLASFVLVVVLTRGLGPTGYGLVATAIAVFTLLSNVGELGADTGLLREIPRLLVQKRARDARAALRVSLYPVLLTGVIMAALVYVYAPELTHLLVRHATNEHEVRYLRALTPFLAVAPAATVALAGTRGFGNLKIFALVQNILVPTARPLAAAAVLLAGLGGLAVVVSWGAPLIAALAAGLFFLFRFMRRAERGPAGLEEPRPTGVVAREFWSFTAARGVAGALAIAITQVNLLLVSGLRSAHDAGVFGAVMRYVSMGTFAFQAMRVAIGPQIARLLTQRRDRDAETVFQTATWWLMALSWPVYLVLGVFASTVLTLFGHGFKAGATALAIVCAAELVDMGTGNVTLVLLMGGRSQWNLLNIALGLATTVGLGFLLIPHYGIVGAAIAWAATIVIENGAATLQVGIFMRMKPFGRGYLYVALASVACFFVLGVVVRVIGLPGAVGLATTVVVGGALYLVLLYRCRNLLRLDLLAQTLLRRAPAAQGALR